MDFLVTHFLLLLFYLLHDSSSEMTDGVPRQEMLQERDVKIDWEFSNCHLQLYEPCPSSKVYFYFYHEKSEHPYLLNASDPRLPSSTNQSLPLKVIIHGYGGNILTDVTGNIRKAYQRIGGRNVLVIDWGRLARIPCYPTSVLNTGQVGQCSAEFLTEIQKRYRPRSIHMIGFSLGAHIASFVSHYLYQATGKRVRRITGLDPALPFFATFKGAYKLDRADAYHVDVIHTNVGVFGKAEPAGHIDFYVNDGSAQPACVGHRNPALCSHLLAPDYFAESITSKVGFYGTYCPSYFQYAIGWCPLAEPGRPEARTRIRMGEFVLRGSRGVYIVKTGAYPPYALG